VAANPAKMVPAANGTTEGAGVQWTVTETVVAVPSTSMGMTPSWMRSPR